jgi:hypothetical protein
MSDRTSDRAIRLTALPGPIDEPRESYVSDRRRTPRMSSVGDRFEPPRGSRTIVIVDTPPIRTGVNRQEQPREPGWRRGGAARRGTARYGVCERRSPVDVGPRRRPTVGHLNTIESVSRPRFDTPD